MSSRDGDAEKEWPWEGLSAQELEEIRVGILERIQELHRFMKPHLEELEAISLEIFAVSSEEP